MACGNNSVSRDRLGSEPTGEPAPMLAEVLFGFKGARTQRSKLAGGSETGGGANLASGSNPRSGSKPEFTALGVLKAAAHVKRAEAQAAGKRLDKEARVAGRRRDAKAVLGLMSEPGLLDTSVTSTRRDWSQKDVEDPKKPTVHVYFGGIDDADGEGHGHIEYSPDEGWVILHRRPFDPRKYGSRWDETVNETL